MKRTTYIFIGVYFGCMLLMLISILTQLKTGERTRPKEYTVKVTAATTETDLKGIEKIVLTGNYPSKFNWEQRTHIEVKQASPETPGKAMHTAGETITVKKEGNTLYLHANMNPTEAKKADKVWIEDAKVTLEISDKDITIENRMLKTINAKNLTMNSLTIHTDQELTMDACKIQTFRLEGNCQMNSSTIENLYMDLDKSISWNFSDSKITTEHLTGSNNRNVVVGTKTHITWKPKNEKAQLTLIMKKEGEVRFSEAK